MASEVSYFDSCSIHSFKATDSNEAMSNLFNDEEFIYTNLPDCWNNLPKAKRDSAAGWVEIYDSASTEFILAKNSPFYAGPGAFCDYQSHQILHLNSKNEMVVCTNLGSSILTATFCVYIIKRAKHIQIEDSLEYQQKISRRYMITDVVLGRGAFGTVHLGRDRVTRQYIAVKISPLDDGFISFDNEARVLRKVNDHARIIELLHEETTAINTYLVIQYAPGGDLRRYLKSYAPLSELEAKDIFRQILEGIKFLHDKNIIHRDIKPSNILLLNNSKYPKVIISDFGIAHTLSFSSTAFDHCGTIAYMAPEVLLGSDMQNPLLEDTKCDAMFLHQLASAPLDVNKYGKPADMWSLGITLHMMLSGKHPYGTPDDLFAYMTNILQNPFAFGQKNAASFSDEAIHLMKRLLNVDSDARCTIDEALGCSWITGIQEAVPIEAAPAATKQLQQGSVFLKRRQPKRKCRSKYKSQGAVEQSRLFRQARFNRIF
ncbi:kinase-like domain-containing protein [Syncephalis fuscata]|nr:kinase-like domain-containing protein [Syncephalis fuscata]